MRRETHRKNTGGIGRVCAVVRQRVLSAERPQCDASAGRPHITLVRAYVAQNNKAVWHSSGHEYCRLAVEFLSSRSRFQSSKITLFFVYPVKTARGVYSPFNVFDRETSHPRSKSHQGKFEGEVYGLRARNSQKHQPWTTYTRADVFSYAHKLFTEFVDRTEITLYSEDRIHTGFGLWKTPTKTV